MRADKKSEPVRPEVQHSSLQSTSKDTRKDETSQPKQVKYSNIDTVFNGYEIALLLMDAGAWFIGGNFILVLFFSFVMLLKAFNQRFKYMQTLSTLNIFLLLIFLCMLYGMDIFRDVTQIKFGYYLFIGNSVAIIYFSRKIQIAESQTTTDYDL